MTDLRLRTPDGHPLQGGYPVVACWTCGCSFADVEVPATYYTKYYRSLAKYGGEATVMPVADVSAEPHWLKEKADLSATRVASLLASRDVRILDLGCGTGSLLGGLQRLGYHDLHGVDPSPESVRVADARPGVRALVGSFDELPSELGTFDCVCMTGVLEHVWDVAAALRSVISLLRPRGVMYVEVPDASRYLDPYVAPFEDFSTEHVNHFSLPNLRWLAARLGLEMVSENAVDAALAPGIVTALAVVAWTPGAPGFTAARDSDFETGILAYANRSAEDFQVISRTLERDLASDNRYILWGIGETAFKLLALPQLATKHAHAYIDGNPARHAFRFSGVPVTGPDDIEPGTIPIVVSSLIRADSIVTAASDMALPNPLIRLDQGAGWSSVQQRRGAQTLPEQPT